MKNYNEDAIVEYYKSRPMSLLTLSKEFNLCLPTVTKVLKNNNCKIYSKNEIFNPNMDENYFENIDNPEKAYFLGIILADGNIHKPKEGGQYMVSLSLNDYDGYILEKLKSEIKTDRAIIKSLRNKNQNNTLSVKSDKMASDLISYGVLERKSYFSTLPKLKNDSLMSHMFRGILDGDGSIMSNLNLKTNKHKHGIAFCGCKDLIQEIKDYLNSKLNLTIKGTDERQSTCHIVTWCKIDDMFRLGNYLYQDSEGLRIERKYEKYMDFKKFYKL